MLSAAAFVVMMVAAFYVCIVLQPVLKESTSFGLGVSSSLQSSSPNKRVQKDPVAASFFLASRARARVVHWGKMGYALGQNGMCPGTKWVGPWG